MPLHRIITNVVIQLPNILLPQQLGVPVLLSEHSVIMDKDGKQTSSASFAAIPVDVEIMTDELLSLMNVELGKLGLYVARLGTTSPVEAPALPVELPSAPAEGAE